MARRESVRESTSTQPNILDIGAPDVDGTFVKHMPRVKRLLNVSHAIQYLGSWCLVRHLLLDRGHQQVNLMGSSKIFGQGTRELRWEFRPNFLQESIHIMFGITTLGVDLILKWGPTAG